MCGKHSLAISPHTAREAAIGTAPRFAFYVFQAPEAGQSVRRAPRPVTRFSEFAQAARAPPLLQFVPHFAFPLDEFFEREAVARESIGECEDPAAHRGTKERTRAAVLAELDAAIDREFAVPAPA